MIKEANMFSLFCHCVVEWYIRKWECEYRNDDEKSMG